MKGEVGAAGEICTEALQARGREGDLVRGTAQGHRGAAAWAFRGRALGQPWLGGEGLEPLVTVGAQDCPSLAASLLGPPGPDWGRVGVTPPMEVDSAAIQALVAAAQGPASQQAKREVQLYFESLGQGHNRAWKKSEILGRT